MFFLCYNITCNHFYKYYYFKNKKEKNKMENVTTNVKIVGELPFQRLVNFFLWNIDEKAEHDFNVIEEKYDPFCKIYLQRRIWFCFL